MGADANTFYFQYVSNRPQPFGPQVFFWFTSQGTGSPAWLQLITDYEQAGQISGWLYAALNGENPAPLNLSLSAGGSLSLSGTAAAVTISGTDAGGASLSGAFSTAGFGWMLLAVVFSIMSMVQNQGEVVQEAASHPLVKRMQAGG